MLTATPAAAFFFEKKCNVLTIKYLNHPNILNPFKPKL